MKKYKYYTKNDFSLEELIDINEELVDTRLHNEELNLFKGIIICVLINLIYFYYFILFIFQYIYILELDNI